MKEKLRKGIALVVAGALVFTSLAYTTTNVLKASEEEFGSQIEQPTGENAPEEVAQNETPQVEEEQLSLTEEPGGEQEQTEPETPAPKEYTVTIEEPALSGGQLYVWTDGSEEAVSFSGKKFEKKAVEGSTFNLRVEVSEGYELESIHSNGSQLNAVPGREGYYQIANLDANTKVKVTYREVKIEQEDKTGEGDKGDKAEPGKDEPDPDPKEEPKKEDPKAEDKETAEDSSIIGFFKDLLGIGTVEETPEAENDQYEITVIFNTADGTKIDEQVVMIDKKTNKVLVGLVLPETPSAGSNKKFTGWFSGENQLVLPTDANAQDFIKLAGENSTITYVPQYEEAYYAYFLSVDGSTVVYTAVINDKSQQITAYEGYEPQGSKVTGWQFGDKTYAPGEKFSISSDVTLTPQVESSCWVTFNSMGGSVVSSAAVTSGKNLDLATIEKPTRAGFTFKGWSKTPNGTVITNLTVNSDTMLYAIWEGADVDYTIVYWGENANDTEYSVIATEKKKAKAGTTVTLTKEKAPLPKDFADREHFTFSHADSAVISQDGSTAINVYYTRNVYTFTFQREKGKEWVGGLRNGHFEERWDESPISTNTSIISKSWTTIYSFSAKYGAYIGDKFAFTGSDGVSYPRSDKLITWKATNKNVYSRRITAVETMPGENVTFHFYYAALKLAAYKCYYYGEDPNGDKTYDGKKYSLITVYNTDLREYNESDMFLEFEGYTKKNAVKENGKAPKEDETIIGTGDMYFYYTRNNYTLTLNNYGKEDKKTVGFDTSLEQYNVAPERPSSVSESAIFKGWYEVDPSKVKSLKGIQPYNFTGKKMPAGNMVLYAYWEEQPVNITITVPLNSNPSKKYETSVQAGTVISNTTEYTQALNDLAAEGKSVKKWVDTSTNKEFDINQAIDKDTSVVAVLMGAENAKYTVSYDLGEGSSASWSNEQKTDEKNYGGGSFASVWAFPSDAEAPAEKQFLNWTDQNGVSYYPGDKVEVNSNVVLTAQYTAAPKPVEVKYYANDGETTDPVVYKYYVGQNPIVAICTFENPGYTFVGWNTKADGSGTAYPYGSRVKVPEGGISLYAQWATLEAEGYTGVYDGQAHAATASATAGYTVEYLVDGKWSTTAPSIKNVGQKSVYIKASKTGSSTLIATVTLKVTPATLKVSTPSASKEYDGTALTADGSVEGLVNGEQVSFKTTGSQTDIGQSENTYELKWDKTAKKSNYTVISSTGILRVTEFTGEVTVTTTGGTFTYDGKAHGATVEVTGLPKGYTVEKATSNATATNVTAKPVQAICNELVIKNPKGTDVTSQLKLKRVNGSITINKATLTVTTPSASKEYDGEPLTKEGKVEGFVNGETATFSTTGTQTSVGSSQNTYSLTWDKTAKAGNYSVSENLGTLTVTEYKGKIVATVSNVTATYDGKAHGATVSVTGLPKGYTATAGSSTTVTDVTTGTTAVCDSLVIKNSKGTDVTDTLDIERVPGTIVINPAPITITTPTVSKTYDGTALTAAGTMEGLVNGETATFSTTGSQTGVGTSNNTYSLVWDGTASSSNYTVNASVGKLTVNEFAGTVTVKTTGGIFTYDGQAHGATVEVFGLPESGYTVETATSNATATDATTGLAATCDNLVIRNAAGADVTSNLTISKEDGSIVINKATLTVNTPSDSKVYNGSALTKAGIISGFVNDETATFRTTGSQTGVGSSQNTYSITWDGTAKECNYSVDANIGTLTVTQYGDEIVVTATGGEFTYDGTNHKATVSVSTLPEGYTLEKASSNAKVKNVSDGEVAATVDELVIRNAAGDDVTSELKVRYVSGTLKVKPAAVSVSTPSQTKTYDGTALTSAGSITGLVGDETVDFKTTGSQTEVGTSKNTYELKWTGTAKQSNYSLTESVGDLTVSEYTGTIDVTTTGETAEYDGQAHGATVSVGTLPTGYTVKTATASATATDVTGASGVAATCDTLVIENAAGVDVTSRLNINKIDGKIVVTPKALTVTTETASKVYDGNALTAGGEITGFVEGEDATFAVTGTQTDVGSSQNTYSLTWDKKAKQGNYTVNESLGTLTVTESKAEVVVTTTGGIFTYDGKAHGATVSVTNLSEGYTVETATSSATATNVADGTVTATCDNLVIKNAKGTDVTDKLNIKKVDGSITITVATLTVVTPDASKTYDGTPLTAEGSISGFVNGETAVFATTGTITEVGTTSNSYSIDWDDEATTASQSNYAVSASVGSLTVEHFTGTITATTTGGSFVYDGQEHAATVSVSQLPAGYTLVSATSNAKATNVADGVVSATCDSIRINDANGNDVTAQLNIEKNTTSLQITAATLTVTTPTRNKVYDGTALTAEGSCTGFVNGETATFATTGSQTAAGFSQNTYSLTWDGTAVQSNYSISESLGTLTVTDTEDEIVVTVTGGTFTYDGAAHGATVSVSTLPAGYRLEKASSNATATNVTADPVIAHCDELVIRNAEGNDVTGKLNISYRNGSITINKAPLTVTMPGASKVYDGEALTQTGTMTGLVAGETATLVNTGTQTAVGESNNTYEINWGSANADNYQVNATVGKLAVTEFSGVVNVVTTGYNGTYDGQAHGAIVQVNGLPAKGYTVETATSSATATDATAGVAATCDALVIRNAAGEDVTAKLNKSFTDGSIVIAKASLTVKTEGATRVYNGKALTAEGQLTGLVNGEEVTFAVTGKQTAVGSSQNTYSITWDKTAKAENYTITSEDLGNLVVTQSKSEIVVTTTGYTGVYDGQEHKATVSVSTLPEGYTLETASSDAAATDVTESPITASCDNLVIVNADGYDVTDELNIRYVDGSISISKATLTVATPDAEKTYDGTALVSAGSISGFVNGETAVFATTGSQTAVGSSQNTYSIDWDAEATTAKAGNYAISESLGTLTVNEFAGAVTVTTTGGTFTYDGQTHGATVSVSTLPEGYTVQTASSNASAKNVTPETGIVVNCDNLVILNADGEDVTSRLNVTKVPGNIVINKKAVTVTTASDSKTYDGTALTKDEGSLSGIVEGETATLRVTGSQIDVGSSANSYEIDWAEGTLASNYSISESLGTLTVTETEDEIVVTVTGFHGTYDGQEHKATISISELPKGYHVDALGTNAKATDATSSPVKAKCDVIRIKNAKGQDVTGQLKITYNEDTIEIAKKDLAITTPDATKSYDGTALTAAGSMSGLVAGETADFSTTGAQTEVGSSSNTYSLLWNGTAKESNYNIVPAVGTLTVSEFAGEVEVKTTGGSFEYDGESHGATVEVIGLPAGYTVSKASSSASAVNVADGTVPATYTELEIKNRNGEICTDALKLKKTDGSITITPATLTVITQSGSKVYDGKALTAEGSIDGFKKGEKATFAVTGSRTAVGTSDNTYSLVFDQTAVAGNYTVNESLGKLTVTESADQIVVTTTGGSFTYDGKAHGATVEVTGVPEGYTVAQAESSASATNVAQGTVTATADKLVITNAEGEDVTSKLNIRKVDGSITINPATVTVTTPDADKTYDGTALTAAGTIEGLVAGETATFSTTGTQTEVGTSTNSYSLVWNGTAAESNYSVVPHLGTLEVKENTAEITVTTTGGIFTYDGQAHGATVEVSTLPAGYTLETATSSASVTDANYDAVAATCDNLVIRNAAGVDVTDRLNIKKIDGTIKVNKATLTVVTPNDTKVYDGTALTKAGTISGFVNDETATFETIGTQTDVGSSDNNYNIIWDGTAKESNYTVSATIGILSVTESKDEITVVTSGGIFTYDGQAHGATVEVLGVPAGYYVSTARSDASATDVTSAEGVAATCDELVIKNQKGEDVTDKLNIKLQDSTIFINPATLTVTTPTTSKTYDGTALTAAGSYEGLVNGETIGFETTGSQTDAGSSNNSCKITWKGLLNDYTAKESNYTVSDNIGKLTVNAKPFSDTMIEAGAQNAAYDGSEHKYVPVLKDGEKTLVEGTDYTVAYSTEDFTNVGNVIVTITGKGNYSGSLEQRYAVTQAPLTIVTQSGSKVYDEDPLTADGEVQGLVEGETVEFSVTGTQTYVGSSKNNYSLSWTGTAVAANYFIAEERIGELTVTENADEIVVTTTGGEFTYDGAAHGATVSVSTLPKGYYLETAASTASATNVDDGTVTATADQLVIRNKKGDDVTAKLNISYNDGSIKINPAGISVITPNAEKTYDGTELTASGSISGFVNGETATFSTTGTQTEVGTSTNSYSLVWDGTATESNYSVVPSLGTLEVKEYAGQITVTTTGGTFTYDGQAHGATVKVSALPAGYTLEEAKSSASVTDANETAEVATCDNLVIRNAAGTDVTGRLNVKKVDGSIKVNKATLTVTTFNSEKVYDGEALISAGSITGFVNDETATFAITGSQTDVGTSDNTYSITWDGTAKEANYSIDATIGKLTVKESENEIVVTTTGGTFTYDGEAHGAFVTVGTLPKGYMLETAESTASVMNVDDGEVTATADQLVIRNAKGEDVTSKLKITYNDGILKISPKDLNVTTTSSSKTYDGSAITAAGSYNGLVEGETIGFEVTGTQTNVGSSDNTYEITWKKTFGDATAVQSNYNVVENLGKLTVNAKAIDETMFTAPTDSVYDGGEHKFVPVLTYGEMTLADGTDYTVSYSTEDFTNAGVVTVTITGQGNYSGSVVKTYSITQAPLTIVTNNGTKVYDGEALTAAGEVQGLVEGETVDFTVTGSRTEVGTSQNTYSLEWTGSANVNNYSIAEEKIGNLTVTENADEIVVTTTGGEFTYDGASHGATVSVSTLPKGYYLETAASTASAINVADGTVTATADRLVIRNAKGEDVTDKLNISRINGSIKINPAALNVVTNGDEKVYDGTALTAGGSVSGYIGTETATFSTTGSQTAVGESTNSYSLVFDQSAIESNYTVSTDLGTLKVKEYAGEITVTTTGGEFTYDGQAHGATVSVSALPAGYTLDTATSSASVTDVNETAATATCDTLVILNAQGEDVTAKLNIRKTDGSIKVNKAVLTVVTPGGEKVYDGEALTSEGSISGFVNYETATFETTGSQTDVGTSDNTYEIVWDGTAKEANYSVEATVGKLTVKESEDEIVVTTTGGEFTYDGQAHGATVSVGALPKGYTLETAASTASVKDVDDGEITATADQLVIRNKKGEDVTSKLKITYLDDNIKITPKTLSVITNPASKTYDGSALTAGGTYSGLVEGETIGFEVTGTQTNVGTSNNTYSITWKTLFGDATAVQSNYSVSESVGTLTVNAKAIDETMFEAPADTVYDGSEHRFVPVITYGEMALAGGTDYTVSYSTQDFTNAGVITVAITGKGNYSGSVVKNYSITKAPLTIVTDTASKVYNGTALTAGGRVNGLVNNETVSFRVTGTQTEVGSSDNSYVIEFNSTAKADNYEITSITVGKLTVRENADEIVVTTTGGEFTYDGQAHGAIVSVSTLPAGYTLETATSDASATDVYEGKVIAGCDNLVIRNAAGTDVTDRLNITYVDGSITILPKTVTVAADPASKTYGDDDPELTAQTEGLLGSDEVIFTVDRASGENAGVYDITPAGDELQGNYRLSFVSGIFTINPKAALVKANDMSKDYGDADPELTATVSGTINGETVNYKLERAEGEVVGDYDITASGDEAQGNYAVSFEGGKFTIKPASSLKITAESYEASYDGKAHGSAAEVNVPDGTAITYSVDGGTSWSNENPTIKNVGEINVLVKAENSNYQTATAEYTLKVNKRQVTLTSPGGSKVYDGQPLPDGTIEIGGEGFAEGEGFAYQFTADRVNVGSRKDTFEYRIIQLKDENAIVKTLDSTFGKTEFEDADENNYEITTVFGDIVITEPPTPIPPVNPPVNPIDAAFNNGNGYTITNVTDGETPLADIAIDSCCIMHFSLLIVAFLLLLGNEMATRDRRRKVRELEARLK